MNLTTATPVEIDTVIAEIYTRYYQATRDLAQQERYLEDYQKGLERHLAGDLRYGSYYSQEAVDERQAQVDTLREQAADILRETRPFNEEFTRRGGWTRFYLVDNAGGHVHSSMECSTCYPVRYVNGVLTAGTEFIWLPEESGKDETEIVEKAGEQACTVCFPSAPVDVLKRKGSYEAPARKAAREAREEKKAAAHAKKVAKALFADDVEKVYKTEGKWGERIGTIAAAKKFLTDGVEWHWDHPMYQATDRDQVAALLAERLGTEAQWEIAQAHKRAAKRR